MSYEYSGILLESFQIMTTAEFKINSNLIKKLIKYLIVLTEKSLEKQSSMEMG